jgi:hypothetical protein
MKILKCIGAIIVVPLLAVAIGLVIVIGIAAMALGDFLRFMGRRFKARLRGDRFRSNKYVPAVYDGPPLVIDADGFVEPPQSRQPSLGQRPQLKLVSLAGRDGGALPVASFESRRTGGRASSVRTPAGFAAGVRTPAVVVRSPLYKGGPSLLDTGVKVLDFPVDPVAQRRLQAARELDQISQSGANVNLVVLAQHRRQPNNVIVLAHHRPFGQH